MLRRISQEEAPLLLPVAALLFALVGHWSICRDRASMGKEDAEALGNTGVLPDKASGFGLYYWRKDKDLGGSQEKSIIGAGFQAAENPI